MALYLALLDSVVRKVCPGSQCSLSLEGKTGGADMSFTLSLEQNLRDQTANPRVRYKGLLLKGIEI